MSEIEERNCLYNKIRVCDLTVSFTLTINFRIENSNLFREIKKYNTFDSSIKKIKSNGYIAQVVGI